MASLFRRIGKYAPSHAVDPRENRLTEAFASVLERVDGLAAALADVWFDREPPDDVRPIVTTQRSTVSGRFVDLELRFSGERPLLVWVEVKHGADLHGDQLESYWADMDGETFGERLLVLLAPRQSMPAAGENVVVIEWQDVARRLTAFARAAEIDAVDRWLVNELVTYLKEEGLADEDALSLATVFALAAWPTAERTLSRLSEVADGYVRASLGEPRGFLKRGGSQKPNYGAGWWITFNLPDAQADRWGKAWFEWGFRSDAARDDGRDAQAFFTGVSFDGKANPMFNAANQVWLSELGKHGFERVQDWYWRLWRYRYPEELLVATSLEEQARALADWVLEAFRIVEASPPPVS